MTEEEEGEDNGDDDNSNKLVGSVLPSEIEAVISQKRLILEYAKNQLRPQNMGGPYSKNLELWSAPGKSALAMFYSVMRVFYTKSKCFGHFS